MLAFCAFLVQLQFSATAQNPLHLQYQQSQIGCLL